eukprot:TRINITY_DN11900_c0_g1_i2.p2 TRINITY_DN11900_c0_g1~~TRINITY_DN11900_c0_g1_i2.p2  ORF type:complete len:132 (+),score=21.15 TRINITY_DN11900_c0_g1_i2:364-759(+)
MWLFGAIMLLGENMICHACPFLREFELMFLAPSLAFMMVYVCCRRNKNVRMSFFGMFSFSAPLLPWIIVSFGLLFERNVAYHVMGLIPGHLYFYLEDIYPLFSSRRLLKTPQILKQMFDVPNPIRPPAQNW